MIASNVATSNREDLEYLERINRSVQGPGFQIIIAGNSPRDFEYKKRVLEIIMEETGGKSHGGIVRWVLAARSTSLRIRRRMGATFTIAPSLR